jgi:hypothetical protein
VNPGELIKRRPTEAITGPAAAPLVYAFMVDRGCDPLLAVLVAAAIAFVPAGISEVVDAVWGSR